MTALPSRSRQTSRGITYWGRPAESADPALAAYGIELLIDARSFVEVDLAHIAGAIDWLVTHQQPDGSWTPHYGDTTSQLNLYIASVLTHAAANKDIVKLLLPAHGERARQSVAKAVAWAATSAAALHDPYANALRLSIATDPAQVAALYAELAHTAKQFTVTTSRLD